MSTEDRSGPSDSPEPSPSPSRIVQVEGGVDEAEAAAIISAVNQVLDDELARRSRPVAPPRRSSWVEAWRPRPVVPPMRSAEYDAGPGWSGRTGPEANGNDEPGSK